MSTALLAKRDAGMRGTLQRTGYAGLELTYGSEVMIQFFCWRIWCVSTQNSLYMNLFRVAAIFYIIQQLFFQRIRTHIALGWEDPFVKPFRLKDSYQPGDLNGFVDIDEEN